MLCTSNHSLAGGHQITSLCFSASGITAHLYRTYHKYATNPTSPRGTLQVKHSLLQLHIFCQPNGTLGNAQCLGTSLMTGAGAREPGRHLPLTAISTKRYTTQGRAYQRPPRHNLRGSRLPDCQHKWPLHKHFGARIEPPLFQDGTFSTLHSRVVEDVSCYTTKHTTDMEIT